MEIQVVIQPMIVIIVLVLIGFFLEKRGTVDRITSKNISTIIMDICNPALMLYSALSGQVQADHTEILTAAGLGAAFYFLLVVIGFLFPRIIRVERSERHFYNAMCVYTNVGFIGIPVAHAILPADGMLFVLVCNVMYSLLFYTHGVIVLSGGKERIRPGKIFSPGTIAAILSLVLFWFRVTPPAVVVELFDYIGGATVFLSMMLLGVAIARSNLIEGMKNIRIWLYVLLRMILFPTALILVLSVVDFPETIENSMCLMAAMPIGNLPLIQAEKTGEDTTLLSGAIAISTIVSMITITVFMSVV